MAAVHHAITAAMSGGIRMGSDRRPRRLGSLATHPMSRRLGDNQSHPSGRGRINAATMIPHHLLCPAGDTGALHAGYGCSINIHRMFSGTLWEPLGGGVCVRRARQTGVFISRPDSVMEPLTLDHRPDELLDLGSWSSFTLRLPPRDERSRLRPSLQNKPTRNPPNPPPSQPPAPVLGSLGCFERRWALTELATSKAHQL